MLIAIDHHSGVPVFRQIMDQVKFHIASGLIGPDDELPSTRALSTELGLNPMTVSKAYSLLEAEGVVERRRGRPLTVRARPEPEMKASRIEQLQPQLKALATRARQLGLSRKRVIELLRDAMRDAEQKEGESE